MKLAIYQVDAFANHAFEGNSAAVCPLDKWLDDSLMQLIAAENNLSETAFFVATKIGFHLRWFTPTQEVELCGHAILASAFVIFNILNYKKQDIVFESKSGQLMVKNNIDFLQLDFPSQPPSLCETPALIHQAFKDTPIACLESQDYLLIFKDEKSIINAEPDFRKLELLKHRGVIIAAKSERYDFVSRFFAPKYGINEDSVTGSAYTQLIPYWSKALGKLELHSKQVSKRGGELYCRLSGDRVFISGKAVLYLLGEIDQYP